MKKIFFFLILFLSVSLNAQWVFQNCDNSVANNFWNLDIMWSNSPLAQLNLTDVSESHDGQGALRMDYTIGAGDSWGGFIVKVSNPISGYYDFTAGEYISLWIKVLSPVALSKNGTTHLELKLVDYDENSNTDTWIQHLPIDLADNSGNWINVQIPLNVTNDPTTGFVNQFANGNGMLDLDKIKSFEWAFVYNTTGGMTPNPTASGSILLDKWELVGNKYPPITTFDNTASGFFNIDDMSWAGAADQGSVQLTDNVNDKIEGATSLQLNYTVNASQDWGGYIRVYKDIPKPQDFEYRPNLVIYIKNEIPHASPNTERLDLNFYIVEDNTGEDETWRIRLPINLSQATGWTRYVLPLKQGVVTAPFGGYILPSDGFAQYFGGELGDNVFNYDKIKSYGIELAAGGTSSGPKGELFSGTIFFDLLQQGGQALDTEVPDAPGNFTVNASTYSNTFTWDDVTNEDSGEMYFIYGSHSAFNSPSDQGVELIGFYYENVGNAIHYLRSPKVDANVTYYYGIRCVDLSGNAGPFTFANSITNMAKGIGVISLNPPTDFNADGNLSEWGAYQPIEIKLSNQTGFTLPPFQIDNDNDLSAEARIAVDDKYLYVAFDIEDDLVFPDAALNSYENDSPELMIGLYNLLGLQHDSYQRGDFPDYQLRFNKYSLSSGNNTMLINNILSPGANYGWFETFPSGYAVEAKIPLSDLALMRDNFGDQKDKIFVPQPGMKIPLDFNINDQDVSGIREGLLFFSNNNQDQSWNNPQRWGNTWTDDKYLILTSPKANNIFAPAAIVPIQWNYTGATNIKIEFSSDGTNYSVVEASVHANQTYNWTVPNIESDNCFIKISDVDSPFYTYINTTPFTITNASFTIEQEDNNGFSKANQTQIGNIISGEISDGNDSDFFKFTGSAGDLIDINASAFNSALYGNLILFDANKNEISSSNSYFGNNLRQRIVFELPNDGEYYIRYTNIWNWQVDINSSMKEKSSPEVTESPEIGTYKISLKMWQISPPELSWIIGTSDLFSTDGRIAIEAASNGNNITVKFEYSSDYSYNNSLPDQSFLPVFWNYWINSDKLEGLTPNTQYNVRVTLESTYGAIQSFGQFTTPPVSPNFIKKANVGGHFNDMEFTSNGTAYAVGSGIYRSSDFGNNWEYVNAIPFFRNIYAIEAAGTSQIATLGEHIIVKSMDGGATWGYEEFPSNNWRDIDFIDFNNGFFCGDGEIIRSTDNGANGTNIYTGDINFNRIIMHDVNTVYAVGDQGAIFKTTDAGNNYSITFHNYKGWQLFGIDFFDYNNGVAVGENGNLLTTTDGGENWNQHYEFNETLYDVKMVSATEFYIVGNNGLIIHSTDGGNTFDIIESGTRNRLKRITLNNGKIWICGDWGTVLGPAGSLCDIEFNVDMRIQHLEGKFDPLTDGIFLRGSFNGWAEEPMTDPDGNGIFSATLSLTNISNYTYKFFTNSQTALNGGWEGNVGSGGPNGDRVLLLEDETQLNLQPVFFDNKSPELTWYSQIRVEDGADLFSGFFGTHPNATDGIDQNIFESALQSAPQPGKIDLRFAIPGGGDFSVRDFRNDSVERIEWIINFQRGSGTDPIKLRWSPNEFPGDILIKISDLNGTAFDINMMETDFIEITDESITSVKIICKKFQTKQYELNSGWNLVSVPVMLPNMSPAAIFSNSVSSVWGYNSGYYAASPLEITKGYWLKNSIDESFNIRGVKPESFIINLVSGWNLIGIFDRDAIITSITTSPANIISSSFFGYNNGYYVPFNLPYGKGFWVKTSASGTIDLSPFKSPSIKKENFIASQYTSAPEINSNWGRILITDSDGRQGVLYDTDKEKVNLNLYEMPPIPPSGIFDIRYESNRYVENLGNNTLAIKINSDRYPIKIKPDGMDLNIEGVVVKKGTEITLNKEMPGIVNVSRVEIPVNFILMQNYPNPFNPSTIIKFGLPERTNVHLEIFNVLGERVEELINKEMEPGFHEITWNVKSLPSGVYIYSIRTSQFNDIKKMMFIK
jgi:photosystem II stability/assembly factor-like uncharacterized protein